MAFTDYEFPNSSYYDADLRELIRLYKALKEEYDGLVLKVDEFYNSRDQLESDFYALKVEMQTFSDRILYRIAEIENRIKRFHFATEEFVEERTKAIFDEMAAVTEVLKTDIALLRNYVVNLNMQTVHDYNVEINKLYGIIEDLRLKPVLDVISPVTGKQVTVQEGLNDVYNRLMALFTNVWALTARQYHYLFLTANQYQDEGLTAFQYDLAAMWFLFPTYLPRWQHRPLGLTATEYDGHEIGATKFDEIGLTAHKWDCLGLWYCGDYPMIVNVADGEESPIWRTVQSAKLAEGV